MRLGVSGVDLTSNLWQTARLCPCGGALDRHGILLRARARCHGRRRDQHTARRNDSKLGLAAGPGPPAVAWPGRAPPGQMCAPGRVARCHMTLMRRPSISPWAAVPAVGPGPVPARSRRRPSCLCDTAAVAIANGVLPARPRGAGDSDVARWARAGASGPAGRGGVRRVAGGYSARMGQR